MAPLAITEGPVDAGQDLQGQATCLAINIVMKYLRDVVNSEKLANKFEEKISASSKNLESINIENKENISIEKVLKKRQSKSKAEKGVASDSTIGSVLIYRYIQEKTSDKLAEKFAKKNNFSYKEAYNSMNKKEQKLSLEGACRKYLKKCDASESNILENVDTCPKKRSLDCTDSDVEGNSQSPKPKKKKKGNELENASSSLPEAENELPKELDMPKAPKNNKPCFKCNQPGHFAKDCTSEITCYNCSKVGHTSKDCPNNENIDSDITCYNCNQTGHSKRNCPDMNGNTKKNFDMECYNCKETGHLSRDCTKNGGVSCYNCGLTGHLSRNCTESNDKLCYNCKKPGHVSKDCKEENGENSKMLCFKCNQVGHMARSCPNVADNSRRRNNYGNNSRGGNRGGGNFNRKFTTAANSIPLGPRKMPGDINKGAE